jgi:two-component system response regulator BaeR
MKIVVAEDEAAIAEILSANLRHDGFEPVLIDNGADVLKYLELETPQLILLDVMLPGMDGYDVCRQIRQTSGVPVIMLTAKVSEADRLKGFDIGADDYVCKPFSPREVIARIKSVIRRTSPSAVIAESSTLPKGTASIVAEFAICEHTLSASFMGRQLDLTFSEFSLLKSFVNHPNRVFERNQLLDTLKQQGSDCTDRAIDSHIKNLRRKLRDIAPEKNIIQSVYGVGYKLGYCAA